MSIETVETRKHKLRARPQLGKRRVHTETDSAAPRQGWMWTAIGDLIILLISLLAFFGVSKIAQ